MAAVPSPSLKEHGSDVQKEVTVILSCHDAKDLPERRIVLTCQAPVVPVGRASKDYSKSLFASQDNALFDNPVMSRNHAELSADFTDKKRPRVYIKDADSFHGTYVTHNDGRGKETKLHANVPVKLENGAIIRFGANIFRARSTFPPCLVDFLMEESEQGPKSPRQRVFTVPDDIDEDEDEVRADYDEQTGEESVMAPFFTRAILHPGVAAVARTSQGQPAIDLTHDGTREGPKPERTSTTVPTTRGDVIDLTSEPEHELESTPTLNRRYGSSIGTTSPVPSQSANDPDTPVEDSSEEDDLRSSEGPWGYSESGGELSESEGDELSDGDEFTEYDGLFYEDDASLPAGSERHGLWIDELTDYEIDSGSESDISVESHIYRPSLLPTREAEADEVSMADTDISSCKSIRDGESDFGPIGYPAVDASKSVGQGHGRGKTPLFADTTPPPIARRSHMTGQILTDDHQVDLRESYDELGREEKELALSDGGAIGQANKNCVPAEGVPSTSSLRTHVSPASAPPSKPPTAPTPSQPRAASPSDPFLFKSQARLDQLPDLSRAQLLGQKSGKADYFAARERNRLVLGTPTSEAMQILASHEVESNSAPVADLTVEMCARANLPSTPRAEPDDHASPSPSPQAPELIKLASSTDSAHPSFWTASGERFINSPWLEDSGVSENIICQAPELDMASAYKFQQSKLALIRSRLVPIKDLLAQEHEEVSELRQYSSTAAKRSFDEAFRDASSPASVQEEKDDAVSLFGGASATSDEDNNAKMVETRAKPVAAPEEARETERIGEQQDVSQLTPAPGRPDSPRPLKKLKLATQVAACVALGSAVTFSFLVNTAPVF